MKFINLTYCVFRNTYMDDHGNYEHYLSSSVRKNCKKLMEHCIGIVEIIRGCENCKQKNPKILCDQQLLYHSLPQETDDTIRSRVVLPLKDLVSADVVKKQLKDLSLKVHTTIQPVFLNRKLNKK